MSSQPPPDNDSRESKAQELDDSTADPIADPAVDETTAQPDPVRSGFDRAIAWCGRGAAWLIFIAMAISVFEIVIRYGFDSPTSWVHESVVMLVAVSFALAGPVALASDRHIRVRVLYDTVGPRFKLWLDRFNDLVTLGFCLGMSYAAYVMFWNASHNPLGEWQMERSGTSWNPPFPALVKGVIMLALVIMTLQALIHLFQSLRARASESTDKRGGAH